MQMGKTLVRTTLFFAIVCAASLIDPGSPLSTRVAEADVLETQLPAVPSCTRLGDNLINNRLIESAAVVGLAGTALTLFSKPQSERILASHCMPEL
jgi:hypothetical protein